MSFYDDSINKITNYVVDNTKEKTEDEVEILKYGIEVIFMNISKLLVIYLLAFIFGYLIETIFITLIFGYIRSFASGIHVKGFVKCLTFSLAIFIFIIFTRGAFELPLIMKIMVSIALVTGIWIYSPADTEEKPYLDEENRKKLKRSAIIVSIIYTVIWTTSILGIYSNYFVSTLIAQLILIHPITYKVLGRRYKNYLYESEYL
ncbi:MAG: accessory gene regulator B family protein [Acidaminobacteraceae bacterium]